MTWTIADIPDQQGRRAVITGANAGLGLAVARALAAAGAEIVLACRNIDKADRAAEEVRAAVPGARLDVQPLDLADLDSVARSPIASPGRWTCWSTTPA